MDAQKIAASLGVVLVGGFAVTGISALGSEGPEVEPVQLQHRREPAPEEARPDPGPTRRTTVPARVIEPAPAPEERDDAPGAGPAEEDGFGDRAEGDGGARDGRDERKGRDGGEGREGGEGGEGD